MDNLIPRDVCSHCLMHPSQLSEVVNAMYLKYTVLCVFIIYYIIVSYNGGCMQTWLELEITTTFGDYGIVYRDIGDACHTLLAPLLPINWKGSPTFLSSRKFMTSHFFILSTIHYCLFNISYVFIQFRIVENEIFLLSYCLLMPSTVGDKKGASLIFFQNWAL